MDQNKIKNYYNFSLVIYPSKWKTLMCAAESSIEMILMFLNCIRMQWQSMGLLKHQTNFNP